MLWEVRRGGGTVVPGFVDPHIHLAAYAASLGAVDCSPASVQSIDEIVYGGKD